MRRQYKQTSPVQPGPNRGPAANQNNLLSLFSTLSSLPERKQRIVITLMELFFNVKPRKLAFIIKYAFPELKNTEIAILVGVSRTSLNRWPEFFRLKGHIKPQGRGRRGFKTRDRRVEAFDEDDGDDRDDG